MSNIDNSQRKKPLSILEFWSIMLGMFGFGFLFFFMGLYQASGGPVLFGIIIFITAFIFRYWHMKNCRDYDDYIRQQEWNLNSINGIVKNANRCFQNIDRNQQKAERALNKAENYLKHPGYNSFWDQIEIAALELVRFSQNLADLSSHLDSYLRAITHYHGVAKSFPGSAREFEKLKKLYRLGRKNALARRMARLLDKADQNFKLASIYQQRKTNKTLARTNEMKCIRLFRPQFSKFKTSFFVEIP